jgi:hypothetical protein
VLERKCLPGGNQVGRAKEGEVVDHLLGIGLGRDHRQDLAVEG